MNYNNGISRSARVTRVLVNYSQNLDQKSRRVAGAFRRSFNNIMRLRVHNRRQYFEFYSKYTYCNVYVSRLYYNNIITRFNIL